MTRFVRSRDGDAPAGFDERLVRLLPVSSLTGLSTGHGGFMAGALCPPVVRLP